MRPVARTLVLALCLKKAGFIQSHGSATGQLTTQPFVSGENSATRKKNNEHSYITRSVMKAIWDSTEGACFSHTEWCVEKE